MDAMAVTHKRLSAPYFDLQIVKGYGIWSSGAVVAFMIYLLTIWH